MESKISEVLAKMETAEADAEKDHDEFKSEAKITEEGTQSDLKYGNRMIKRVDKKTASKELSAVIDYEEEVKDKCIAKPESYEERSKRRNAEIKGLQQALFLLKKEAASFLQRRRNRLGLRGYP